jgi:hypothetical protein
MSRDEECTRGFVKSNEPTVRVGGYDIHVP